MSELQQALRDIRRIRQQVAETTEFRGYGPATMVGTACLAVVAAVLQSWIAPDPAHMPVRYLSVWFAAAALALTSSAIGVVTRSRRMHSGLSDEMIRMAAQQFAPSVLAGLLLTLTITFYVPASLWMLPGLWQIVCSLGIFASCRSLPRAMFAPACWFLGTGLICVALAGPRALAPWCMGVPFAFGQMLIAVVLRLFAERMEDTDA